jgi:hypothetical protein
VWPRHRRGVEGPIPDRRPPPSVEPPSRRRWIDPQSRTQPPRMTPSVQQHVGQGVPHLARSSQEAGMKALGEHGAAAAGRPVQRACDACADRHHAATERVRVGRFDEKVCVRRLQAVVHEAKVDAITNRREAPLERADEGHAPQGREPGEQFDRHVCGKPGRNAFPAAVRNVRLRSPLASRARSAASPPAMRFQTKSELRGTSRHQRLEYGDVRGLSIGL